MLIMVAVHRDGDILGQRRLSDKGITELDKCGFGFGRVDCSIDSMALEYKEMSISDLPQEVQKFIDEISELASWYDLKFIALDDRFHDAKKDFDEDGWFERACK